jgi:hypothetical protein
LEQWALSPGLDETSRWAFIVGAPRCGTTSLSEYLRGHPEVCFSTPKEPHFFLMEDLRGRSVEEARRTISSKYLSRFFSERQRQSVFAEGSVSYFYAPERLEPILKLWPRAKFIICVRNPVEMVPSLHQRLFYNGDETERQFERAWSLVPTRREGRSIPRSCLDPRFLDYWEAGYLGKHLEKFLEVVGRERCMISVFDDFKADPGREYRRVLEFLDLPDDHKSDFDRHAESKDCRIAWVHRLMKRPPRAAMWLFDSEDLQVIEGSGSEPSPLLEKILDIRQRIINWNKVPATKPHIDGQLVDEMRAMFQDDVALLSKLLGRNLNHWMDAA